MTYCVGIRLNAGLVFLSDSRTNAGLDAISTFRKMMIYEQPGERFMVMLSAGNLVQGDVPIITDYRQALSEVVSKRLGNAKTDEVFPGFAPTTALGVA